MSRLIHTAGIPYEIELNDRPRFRFGNGECQRAVSKIHLSTPSLGRVSFYLLDGGAERTPMLLGSRDLRSRKAMVSYYGEYLAHRSPIAGNWWANTLTTFRGGGHLILDLLEPRTPLRFLIQRLNNQLNGPRPHGDDEPRTMEMKMEMTEKMTIDLMVGDESGLAMRLALRLREIC